MHGLKKFSKPILPIRQNYFDLIKKFQIKVPKFFNISEACCDKWIKNDFNRVAITNIDEDNYKSNWTYGKIHTSANSLANSLIKHGVKKGDRIVLMLPQGPEVIISHFASYKIGAIVVPLFTLFGPDAIQYRLKDSGAKILITNKENFSKIEKINPDSNQIQSIYCTENIDKNIFSFWDEINNSSENFENYKTLSKDPAIMIYTSGTTGHPKGVLHAHRFLLGHLPNIEISHDGFPKDRDCGWTPADWSWIGGLMDLAMPCLYYGVPLISYRMKKFDPKIAWKLIGKEKIRNLFLPPTALKLMREIDVPSNVNVRTIASGGESVGEELLKWAKNSLGITINEIYGQTECNLVISSNRSIEPTPKGSMGKVVPGHEIMLMDSQGKKVPPNKIGEIAVKSPHPVIFLKYWNKREETRKKFLKNWLLTGDLGKVDKKGFFTFISRNDDVIISSGYRIGPSEIEDCLLRHESVLNSAVIGVPDKTRTEIIKAFIVLNDGFLKEGLKEELINFVRINLSPHLMPKEIEWISDLPMTATGKIMRNKLRKNITD